METIDGKCGLNVYSFVLLSVLLLFLFLFVYEWVLSVTLFLSSFYLNIFTSDSDLISSWNIFLDTKPEFTKKLADLKKKIKEKATFVCELNKENVKVIWKKNGKELKSEKNVKIVADKKSHQLIIEDVTVEDGGEYSCVAGDISTSAKLTVEGEGIALMVINKNIL